MSTEPGTNQINRFSNDELRNQAAIDPIAWRPRHELDFPEWLHQGRRLGAIGRGVAWWIGDWLTYGNAKFGEKYSHAAQITGYDVQSLMNMVYVASRFEFGRRRETLSWSHHAELAALEPGEQDRWLRFADEKRLSVRRLRDELRARRRTPIKGRAMRNQKNKTTQPVSPDTTEDSGHDRVEQGEQHDLVCPNCGYHLVPANQARYPTSQQVPHREQGAETDGISPNDALRAPTITGCASDESPSPSASSPE